MSVNLRSFLRPGLLHPLYDRRRLQLPSPSHFLWQKGGVDLADMFGELKTDLEADVAFADEDPETTTISASPSVKWGLLDEAIRELQKSCPTFDRRHPFPKIIQTTPGWYSVSWKTESPSRHRRVRQGAENAERLMVKPASPWQPPTRDGWR